MSGVLISVVPLLVLFFIPGKQLVACVMHGAVKGWGSNPHIKYHSARRGYIACTATPATMRADFKILDRVTVADQPIRVGGSLVVEAGRRGAQSA